MFTQGEIDRVIKECNEVGPGSPSIDFDWFEPVVETASRIGVLGHNVMVIPTNPGGRDGYALVLVVNGVRFMADPLYFEEEWAEEYKGEPVSDSVSRLLKIAVREIKKIETARDTWYVARRTGL